MHLEWRVETDRDRCIGSGTCASTAPDVFDVDDAGRAVVIGPVAAGDERVRDAVRHCPTSALRLAGELRLAGKDER